MASVPAPVAEETIAEAVAAEEHTRSRAFARTALFMVVLVAAQLPLLEGDARARTIAALSMAIMFLTSSWALWRSRTIDGDTSRIFRVHGYVLAACMFGVMHFMGFFSPVTVVLSLGIYYLGQSNDRLHAILLPLLIITGWVGGCVLIMAGLMRDVGLFSSAGVAPYSQTVMVSGVGSTMLLSLWLASIARRSMREAILQSNEALIELHKRGALLHEAHNQLDRAMRMAVGKPGRHTGELAGEYRMAEVIGLGAMGEVYAAQHDVSGAPAAVKLLHRDALRREDMVVRFLREAAVCTGFDQENLVRVFDVGRMDDGAPYMVMERLEGQHLSAVLRERGHLSTEEVLTLSACLSAGLEHAHAQGVVHRDLKPHNIVRVERDGRTSWTILDFGISKLVDSSGTLTGDGGVLGTPAYMSPEQARGREVDGRSDVFSMAAVLYRALSGVPAFPGKDTPRIMFAVAYAMPARPSAQVRGVPAGVDAVLAVALAKESEQRFETPRALDAALRAAIAGELDAGLRARADAVLARRPWGYTPDVP